MVDTFAILLPQRHVPMIRSIRRLPVNLPENIAMNLMIKLNLLDRFGNEINARLLDNGHIQVGGNAWRYTYARLMRTGEIELYDEDGNFSTAVEAPHSRCN